jgi:hypothetical protein
MNFPALAGVALDRCPGKLSALYFEATINMPHGFNKFPQIQGPYPNVRILAENDRAVFDSFAIYPFKYSRILQDLKCCLSDL